MLGPYSPSAGSSTMVFFSPIFAFQKMGEVQEGVLLMTGPPLDQAWEP